MLDLIKTIWMRGKLKKASFHVLTWDLQGIQVDWKLLEKEVMDCQTGYPPDLICFQNVPVPAGDSAAKDFIRSFPQCLDADYHMQGPVVEKGQAFVTLVRKETIYFDPLFAEPVAPQPIRAGGVLIGIKSLLQIEAFPRTSLSICNCNLPADTPPDPIVLAQNEDICLIAGMFVLDGKTHALPAMGVMDHRDFRLTAAACPAPCAPGMPSAARILYYSVGSANNDPECELWGVEWNHPRSAKQLDSGLTETGKKVFGQSLFQVSPGGWEAREV